MRTSPRLTPARVAGLLIVAAGILAVQVAIDLLTDAVAGGRIDRTGFRALLLLVLALVLPVMAGGIYLVHKGRIEAPPEDR